MHVLSKVMTFLLQPSSLAMLCLAVGIALLLGAYRRWGARLAAIGLGALLIGGLSPLGNALILPLEERFADLPLPAADAPVAGIIILGGAEDGRVSAGRGGLGLNEAAERITEGARLALKRPDAKVVFTGGVGGIWPGGVDGTVPIQRFLADVGIAPERIVLESQSRNTYENAVLTKELVGAKPGQRWLLVTSAYHMPRAMGAFRRAGFDVTPVPVDFRTKDMGDLTRPFDGMPDGLKRVDMAAKEWIGLAAYWLLGRSSELYPSPSTPNDAAS